MVDARFRDLCLDAVDAPRLGAFWAAALGRVVVPDTDDDAKLVDRDGTRAGLTWINAVPEPHTVKGRVHLDVRMAVADPSPLVALGARVLREPGDDIHWWVLVDPEGNEFCAFGPASDAPARDVSDVPDAPGVSDVSDVFELVTDAVDPVAIATWWAARLGGRVVSGERPWGWIEGAEGFPYEAWVFNPVPEPKTVKNRLHWDVNLSADDPFAFVAAGARILEQPKADADWWVLADPEGNEFCAFSPAQA